MRQPAILSTLEYDALTKGTENDCFTSFLLNVPAQALLPRLSIGTAFRASGEHQLILTYNNQILK